MGCKFVLFIIDCGQQNFFDLSDPEQTQICGITLNGFQGTRLPPLQIVLLRLMMQRICARHQSTRKNTEALQQHLSSQ